jgi:LmbE family N-acetylglucosaminyl deacetylase
MKKFIQYIIGAICVFILSDLSAEAPKRYNSSEIYKMIQKMNVLGNALYVAAHPDDENTRMITYLSKGELVNTAYLSLTRGDGGQNSIGPEQSELLGVIRTQELLSARRVDGGTQFFTRVMDFGYSKSADETLNIWNKDELLEDAIWIIRKFKPDVIITRFPSDRRAGHGQHEASAIIAEEAFDLAMDPNIYPGQLEFVDPWQPARIFMNTGRWWNPNIQESDSVISLDIGEYDPLSGLSYSELGADSRSQHRSQAFGITWRRGTSKEYLEFIKGEGLKPELFDGIDITWNRINRRDIASDVSEILDNYDFRSPAGSIPDLIKLRGKISELEDKFWKEKKLKELDDLIRACAGLYLEATSGKPYLSPEDIVNVTLEITNRSDIDISVVGLTSKALAYDTTMSTGLKNNAPLYINLSKQLKDGVRETSPYWLEKPVREFKYEIQDQNLKGLAQNPVSIEFEVKLKINKEHISYCIPVVYTWTDRMEGQQYEPLEIGPKLFVEITEGVFIFPDEKAKDITIKLDTRNQPAKGNLFVKLPEGWRTEPDKLTFDLMPEETAFYHFKLFPTEESSHGYIQAFAEIEDKEYDRKLVSIEYEHFPKQSIYLPSVAEVVKLDIQKKGSRIAYIKGAGDEVGPSLEQIGYEVTYVDEGNIELIDFEDYDAIVFGIMAFNNHVYLGDYNNDFLKYMENGGNVIIQYNNIRIGTKSPILLPYPIEFSGRSASVRVSVEDAEVRILEPDHEILNTPNKISSNDFNGWVQERGLYFPVSWDEHYHAILSSNDPGEEALDGGLLVARYGKGHYIYTTYAWFRQLPAGVPGAYRIFANLISIGR